MAAARKSPAKGGGFKVTAPLVQVSLGDRATQFYAGDLLPDGVSEESLEHLKSLGYVEDTDAPADDN